MSHIEREFLYQALEIGLAETIAETLRDINRSIADLPAAPSSARRRRSLEDQRLTLRKPTLRTTAALVVSICVRTPALTPRIQRAFSDLAERHPELAWFYVQLPTTGGEPLRRAS